MNAKQLGFAHQMAIIAVVVVAAIGGVGYMVFSKNSDDNDNKASQNNSASTTSATDNTTSSKSADEKNVKAAAKEHFTLVYAKKYEEAYNNETCKEFRDLASYDEFLSLMSNQGYQAIDLSAIEYTSVDVRNDQAVIQGEVGPLSPDKTLKVSLLKKDGSWCIYGYQIE